MNATTGSAAQTGDNPETTGPREQMLFPSRLDEVIGSVITGPDAKPFHGRVVAKDGHIVSVGPLATDLRPGLPFVCPGFLDAHTHPLELGLEHVYVSLAPARSIDEVLTLLAQRLRDGPESGIMLGFNLEPDLLVESRFPTRQELDRVSNTVPILLYRVDGHSAVVNSKAFDAGLAAQDLDGCERDASGHLNGVLHGRAYEQTSERFKSRLEPSTVLRALEQAGWAAARAGVTTIAALVGNDGIDPGDWLLLLRGLAMLSVRAVPFVQTRRPELARRFRLPRLGGCLLIDGSFGSRTAALSTDYADEPGNRGISYFEDHELLTLLKRADGLRLQTAFHAIGDRAVEQLVRCHEQVGTRSDLRHRIEHAELLNQNLIDRIAGLGLVLCVQPAFEITWGGPNRMYAKRLGERWKQTNPYRSMLRAGIKLAGGSDAPITRIDPLSGIAAAVNHPNPAERISPAEAMALFTTNGAYSLFLEDKVGRIEPGFDADIVLLDNDPRTTATCRVLATYRAGMRIFPASEP